MTGGYDLKPYTSKAKKAIDLAARISKKMNYSYVGTEHILAGLIKEGTGVAAEVLTACNVEYDRLISMIDNYEYSCNEHNLCHWHEWLLWE